MPIKIIGLLSGQFGRPRNAFDKKNAEPTKHEDGQS